jgi:hypothetical protein
MENNRQKLDNFIKQVKDGDYSTDDFISKTGDVYDDALIARNLTEEALAREVLKNTGVPIPGKGSNRSQIEKFFNDIVRESYPELNPDVRVRDGGEYYHKGKIGVSDFLTKNYSPEANVGKVLHEAGHMYDDKILKTPSTPLTGLSSLRAAKAEGLDPKNMDRLAVYENILSKNHHAKIPNLREGSYGFGALKSLLKNNTFKAIGPVTAIGGALAAGSASDALADTVVPGGVESLGEGSDQVLNPEQQQSVEASRQLSAGEPMNQARFQALQKMVKR